MNIKQVFYDITNLSEDLPVHQNIKFWLCDVTKDNLNCIVAVVSVLFLMLKGFSQELITDWQFGKGVVRVLNKPSSRHSAVIVSNLYYYILTPDTNI